MGFCSGLVAPEQVIATAVALDRSARCAFQRETQSKPSAPTVIGGWIQPAVLAQLWQTAGTPAHRDRPSARAPASGRPMSIGTTGPLSSGRLQRHWPVPRSPPELLQSVAGRERRNRVQPLGC